MNRDPRLLSAVMLALLPPTFAAASVSDRDLAHCATIEAADARLACYDVLAGRAPASPATAAPSAAVAASASGAAAAGTAVAAAAAAPAATAATARAAPAAAAGDASTFGFSKAQLHVADQGPQSIEARVTHVAQNRQGGVNVELDNGETWSYKDESSLPQVGDLVTIKRGALGSYLMITKTKLTMHVQRVK